MFENFLFESKRFKNWRYRYEQDRGKYIWTDERLIGRDIVNIKIKESILSKSPLLVGKIGSNEQILMLWASNIPIDLPLNLKWRVKFKETIDCETHAGVRPRNEESYLELYHHFVKALSDIDIMGLFKLPREEKLWSKFAHQSSICQHIFISPFFSETSWSQSLSNKRVFVVSPFLDLFKSQLSKRNSIWPDCEYLPDLSLDGYKFPYLTDQSCTLNWQDVYQDVLEKMTSSQFDIALFGCGALGLPLAYEAKRLGKVGIHLGGTLQLLFGVYGKRYQDHPYFNKYINDSWVRPETSLRPKNYKQIEGGCYW